MLQGKVKKLLIIVFVGMLFFTSPFNSVYADADIEEFSIPYTQINIYKYFQNTGFTLDQVTTYIDSNTSQDKYECGNTTNSNYCLAYYKDRSTTDAHYVFNFGQIRATYTMPTQYSASNNFTFTPNNKYLFAFITDKTTISNSSAIETRYYYSGTNYYTATDYHRYLSNYTLYYSEYTYSGTNNQPVTASLYNMGGKTFNVIPLYYGDINNCPSDVYKLIYGNDPDIEKLINKFDEVLGYLVTFNFHLIDIKDQLNTIANGNTQSNSSANSLKNKNTNLSSDVNSLGNLESTFNTDFNNAYNQIDFNNTFLNTSGLLSSMNWVRVQYNRMTANNALGSLIQYSLLFGLGLIVIGRQKK